MNSTRLPGKVLMDIKGKPMLQHIVDRARASNVDNVVVATNDISPEIVDYCNNHGIPSYEADDETLNRYLLTALKFDASPIVRLWGDCPLVIPKDINTTLKLYDHTSFQYIYHERHIGVFSLNSLNNWSDEIEDEKDREDFHLYLLEHKNGEVCHIGRSLPFKDSVDTMEDLEFIRGIYELLP